MVTEVSALEYAYLNASTTIHISKSEHARRVTLLFMRTFGYLVLNHEICLALSGYLQYSG